ncbi:MAG: cytochrome c [Alphaproteobacteria bacterium]|nr:cytochrome c [Alphaproteobacteria bacterium]
MRAAALALIAVSLSACASSPSQSGTESQAGKGRDYAVSHCAGCHNIDVKGVSTYRAAPPFRTLRGRWNGESLQLRLERSPVHESFDMPRRYLTDEEADDIAAFITAVRAGKPPPGAPPRAIFCNPMWWC